MDNDVVAYSAKSPCLVCPGLNSVIGSLCLGHIHCYIPVPIINNMIKNIQQRFVYFPSGIMCTKKSRIQHFKTSKSFQLRFALQRLGVQFCKDRLKPLQRTRSCSMPCVLS